MRPRPSATIAGHQDWPAVVPRSWARSQPQPTTTVAQPVEGSKVRPLRLLPHPREHGPKLRRRAYGAGEGVDPQGVHRCLPVAVEYSVGDQGLHSHVAAHQGGKRLGQRSEPAGVWTAVLSIGHSAVFSAQTPSENTTARLHVRGWSALTPRLSRPYFRGRQLDPGLNWAPTQAMSGPFRGGRPRHNRSMARCVSAVADRERQAPVGSGGDAFGGASCVHAERTGGCICSARSAVREGVSLVR